MEVVQIPALSDNYIYLLYEPGIGAAVVDPAVAEPVQQVLEERGWSLVQIVNTHHHYDHIGGNDALAQTWGCPIFGGANDRRNIGGMTDPLEDGAETEILGHKARVFHTPGHTLGHICYYLEDENLLLCGDTLFSIGCGRLFEGTAEQMQRSLARLRELPDDTWVACAHEYTVANLEFARSIEPNNQALAMREGQAKTLRMRGDSTVPSKLGQEKKANPFLRWDDPALIEAVQQATPGTGDDPVAVFGAVRTLKDRF